MIASGEARTASSTSAALRSGIAFKRRTLFVVVNNPLGLRAFALQLTNYNTNSKYCKRRVEYNT